MQNNTKIVALFLVGKGEARLPRERTDSGALADEEKSSKVSLEVDMPQSEVFSNTHHSSDVHDTSGAPHSSAAFDSSLVLSPGPNNHSLTFVTPSSSIFTTPRGSPTRASPSSVLFPSSKNDQTPNEAEQSGDESGLEEKPPYEEKHVTSTPYLGVGSLRDSICKRFATASRLDSLREISCEESFIDDAGRTLNCP